MMLCKVLNLKNTITRQTIKRKCICYMTINQDVYHFPITAAAIFKRFVLYLLCFSSGNIFKKQNGPYRTISAIRAPPVTPTPPFAAL